VCRCLEAASWVSTGAGLLKPGELCALSRLLLVLSTGQDLQEWEMSCSPPRPLLVPPVPPAVPLMELVQQLRQNRCPAKWGDHALEWLAIWNCRAMPPLSSSPKISCGGHQILPTRTYTLTGRTNDI
jgi:hypothetical protein